MEFTPTQLHYLKRELIAQQLQNEIEQLKRQPDLSALRGKTVPASDAAAMPLLQYMTTHLVVPFPLLKKGDEEAFWTTCQTFLDEIRKLELDTYTPKRADASQRQKMLYKLEQMLVITMSASIKTLQGKEESVKVDPGTQAAMGGDESESATRLTFQEESSSMMEEEEAENHGVDINIVTVRDVNEKRTLREKRHAEFVIKSRIGETVYHVARRHGQFRDLQQDLKKEYPTLDIPTAPSKPRDPSYANHTTKASHLYREKDRILLRAFLRRITASSKLAKSALLADFLTQNSFELSAEEAEDARLRLAMDEARANEAKRFQKEVDAKIVELNELLDLLKTQIMQPGGLLEIFEIIKRTEKMQDLPVAFRKAFEWGRINLALVLHTQFVTSDRSVENLANLKRTHALMPYRAMAQILKVSNPFYMVKGILDLFLAQPLGGRSLFQRLILVNLNEESKELQKNIERLESEVDDAMLCKKIENAVATKMPDDAALEAQEPMDDILALLRSDAIEPSLTAEQIIKVGLISQPQQRQLLKKLRQLWVLRGRKHDQDLLRTLAFQGVTGDLLKKLFAIFYQPLAQVYKAANIGESLQHLSAFINDLIELLETMDVQDASDTAKSFVQLVERHEQQFYTFVHNVYVHDKSHLFDELLSYMNTLVGFVAHGIPGQIDMEAILTAAGVLGTTEREALCREVDALIAYHVRRKERRLERTRRKMMAQEGVPSPKEEEVVFDFLPNSAGVMNVLQDMAELEQEDGSDDEDEEDGDEASSKTRHEMTLEPPILTVMPRITPLFTSSVVQLLANAKAE